jgi:HPt (histidine-containing phosphotransfer) domain-containing protein
MRETEKEQCAAAGYDDFLAKPIDLELLCAMVDRWTKAAPSAVEPTPAAVPAEPPVVNEWPDTSEASFTREVIETNSAPPTSRLNEAPAANEAEVLEVERVSAWSRPSDPPAAPQETPATPEAVPATPDVTEAWVADAGWEALPVLDSTRIETSSMGSPELRAMLVDAFLARTQQPLARLRLAHGAGDASQVEIQAHALSGLCATIGAMRAAALFDAIAASAQPERMVAIEPMVERSAREVRRAMESIEPRAEAA